MNKQLKELQKEIRITAKLLLIGTLILTIFAFIGSVSASSIIGQVPDVTLNYDSVGYKLWLWDYYDIDINEEIRLRFEDPINGRLVELPPNYATLNLECFEMSYGFEDRGNGWYEDVITFQSYNETCNVNIEIDFINNGILSQNFDLNIVSESSTEVNNNNTYYNFSGSLLSKLKAYYPFESNLLDMKNNFDGYTLGNYYYNSSGFKGDALRIGNMSNNIFLSGLNLSNNTFGVSFWIKMASCSNDSNIRIYGSSQGMLFNVNPWLGLQNNYQVTGLSGSFDNNVWVNLVYTTDGANSHIYENGVNGGDAVIIPSGINDFYINKLSTLGGCRDVFIDEFMIFNSSLNSSDVSQIYNSGNGINILQSSSPYAPSSSVIPDIYLNQSQNFSIIFNSYFTGWRSVYLLAKDPINDWNINLYPGMSTVNTDYFELDNYASGVNITTYQRPYEFNLTIFACNTTIFTDCSNRTVRIVIGGSIANVTRINTLLGAYDLDFFDSETFAGNYYYQYYDKLVLSFPDSNYTGIVGNESFEYTIIEEPVLNASYMVILECNVTGGYYTYNYLGDINITAECGDGKTYFTLTAYNNYNQRIYLTGVGSKGSLSDYTQLYAGNPTYPSGYVPTTIEPDTTAVDENINEFGGVLPQNLSDKNKHRVTFLILFIINGLIIVGLFRQGTLCLFACLIATTIILFLFASQSYITNLYPVLTLFITLGLGAMKVVRGG